MSAQDSLFLASSEAVVDDLVTPVDALALLVEACERGEANLRPYLDTAHDAIERGCPDCAKYAEIAGRFQAAASVRAPALWATYRRIVPYSIRRFFFRRAARRV